MAYRDGRSPSISMKLTLSMLTLIGVIFAIEHLKPSFQTGDTHHLVLLSCILIFYVRLVLCLFTFIKRKVSWFEGISVGILYGIMVAMFTIWGTQKSFKNEFIEIAGIVLYVIGSIVNSLSDFQRYKWKKHPMNQGKIYTKGLFRYAMHINFFGDSLMFVGFATVTQNAMSFIPVLFIIFNFILVQIPQLDDYLKNKYGLDFELYAEKTKKFIPFIY